MMMMICLRPCHPLILTHSAGKPQQLGFAAFSCHCGRPRWMPAPRRVLSRVVCVRRFAGRPTRYGRSPTAYGTIHTFPGSACICWHDESLQCADCVFSQLGGPTGGLPNCTECRAGLISEAQVTLQNAKFEHRLADPGSLNILAVMGGNVLIQRSADIPRIERGANSTIYTDAALRTNVQVQNGTIEQAASIPTDPAVRDTFLSTDDPWFTDLKQVQTPPCFPLYDLP